MIWLIILVKQVTLTKLNKTFDLMQIMADLMLAYEQAPSKSEWSKGACGHSIDTAIPWYQDLVSRSDWSSPWLLTSLTDLYKNDTSVIYHVLIISLGSFRYCKICFKLSEYSSGGTKSELFSEHVAYSTYDAGPWLGWLELSSTEQVAPWQT